MSEVNPIDVQRALRGVTYPTDREHLAEKARANGADEQVVSAIADLPESEYDGPDKVEKAVFKHR